GRGGAGRGGKMPDIDFMLAAIIQDLCPQGILADQSRAKQGERNARFSQIDEHVIRSAASPLGLALNIAKLLRLWVDVDHLDLIDDPIAASQQTEVGICLLILHSGKSNSVWQ